MRRSGSDNALRATETAVVGGVGVAAVSAIGRGIT